MVEDLLEKADCAGLPGCGLLSSLLGGVVNKIVNCVQERSLDRKRGDFRLKYLGRKEVLKGLTGLFRCLVEDLAEFFQKTGRIRIGETRVKDWWHIGGSLVGANVDGDLLE